MSKYIRNNAERHVILRLNSGKSLFLETGTTSGVIPDEEVNNNRLVKKLQERRIITVAESKTDLG